MNPATDPSNNSTAALSESAAHTAFVLGFAGFSGSGKTTLIEQLLPLLRAHGLRTALIKHAHHNFDMDVPGKDSWRHRQAGAQEVLITSAHRWVLLHELRGAEEPSLETQIARLSPCDLILVEGFKYAPIPKIEVHRPHLGKPTLWPDDPYIVAVASDTLLDTSLPQLDLNQSERVLEFILRLRQQKSL